MMPLTTIAGPSDYCATTGQERGNSRANAKPVNVLAPRDRKWARQGPAII